MRTSYLVAISLLAVVFAGCTDEPPSAEFSSSGSAVMVAGSIESLETEQFESPAQAQNENIPDDQACLADDNNAPNDPADPFEATRCTYAYTTMVVNFTGLPDPSGRTYTIHFNSDATGTTEEIGALEGVHEMNGAYMGNYEFDNTSECDGQKGEAATEACDKTVNFDSVSLMLDDILVAQASLSSGAAFEVHSSLTSGTFSGMYDGKDFTVTLSGMSSNLTYEIWLVTVDDAGLKTHAESFTGAAGENMIEAAMTGDKYAEVHVHVTGTKLNVGIATLA